MVVALSDVVVVAEADMHSGSMVSARLALEQQKTPFCFAPTLRREFGHSRALRAG
ncbi:hypothetical protein HBZS_116790 [Helicobacter bizzozeronii CCUG 35545]|nr:hypothetical protein HBZS_116790 [Helicobacter bizzozeronii CCUG 35545]